MKSKAALSRKSVQKPKPGAYKKAAARTNAAKKATRSSLVGLTIYPPAEPPRKIPRAAFNAFNR